MNNRRCKRINRIKRKRLLYSPFGRSFISSCSHLTSLKSSSTSPPLFFNISSVPSTPDLVKVLSLGPKFIPRPCCITDTELTSATARFARSLRILWHFRHHVDDRQLKFYLPNPLAPIAPGDYNLETYIHNVQFALRKKMREIPPFYPKISSSIINICKQIKSNNDIIIVDSDKNLGPAVLDSSQYDDLVFSHLNDTSTYKSISKIEAESLYLRAYLEINNIVNSEFDDFFRLSNPKTFEWLNFHLNESVTVPSFRILPKFQKSGPLKCRPISGAVNWITTAPSKLVSALLQPTVTALSPTIIRDSKALVNYIENTIIPSSTQLISFDVVSLYTNMHAEEIVNLFTQYLPETLPKRAIISIICWVLKYSLIQFKESFFQQISGMAMGTNMAVNVAQLFLYFGFDKSQPLQTAIENHKLSRYGRYLDDSIALWHGRDDELEVLFQEINHLIPGIQFTMVKSDTHIEFLDVIVFKLDLGNGFSRICVKTH